MKALLLIQQLYYEIEYNDLLSNNRIRVIFRILNLI